PNMASPINRGTTSSDCDALSQAIRPGKELTSSIRCVFFSDSAVPHTPFPYGIRMQAGNPWNGPSMSSSFSHRQKPTQFTLDKYWSRSKEAFANTAIWLVSHSFSDSNCFFNNV